MNHYSGAADCYANAKTTHLPIIVPISVSKLDDARPTRDVKAGRAPGARRERELSIYFNQLVHNFEAQAGLNRRRLGEDCYRLLV